MITAIITARAGSKGLPGKNMLDLGGKPLIQHTFDVAVESKAFDQIILSTDYDDAIDLAKKYKDIEVPFKRPEYLCNDSSSQLDVVNHVLDFLENRGELPGHFILLQPTAPFRTTKELMEGASLLRSGYSSVIGVTPVMHHPADYLVLDETKKVQYLMPEYASKPRQSFPPVYFNNGAFYGAETAFFRTKKVFYDKDSALLMMNEFSLIDIDTQFDFMLASSVINRFSYAV